MDAKTCSSSSSVTGPQRSSNHDELFMQQSLLFADTLTDLKNLSKQLYSAAEYFELSYRNEEQKQEAVKTLKDYAIKALINTVDHLGTVACKIDSFVDEKMGEISALDLTFSCVEQRLQSCQGFISKGGLSQHSLAAKRPQYHKHYKFPVNETINAAGNMESKCHQRRLSADYNLYQQRNDVHETNKGTPSFYRQRSSPLHSPWFPPRQGPFTMTRNPTNKKPEKRAASPLRFPILHSGSLLKRSVSPTCIRTQKRCPSEPRRSLSSSKYDEKQRAEDFGQYSNKSKHLLKAMLGMGKSRKSYSLSKFTDGF